MPGCFGACFLSGLAWPCLFTCLALALLGLARPCFCLVLPCLALLALACSFLLCLEFFLALALLGRALPCSAVLGSAWLCWVLHGLAYPCVASCLVLLGLTLLGLTYPCLSCHVRCPLNIPMISIIPSINNVFLQQKNFAMGSLAQIGSGAMGCSFNTRFRTRFRRVLVQIPREVPEGSGAVLEVSGAAT